MKPTRPSTPATTPAEEFTAPTGKITVGDKQRRRQRTLKIKRLETLGARS
jgi:hypothetical protein